jgi:hypothetical protein
MTKIQTEIPVVIGGREGIVLTRAVVRCLKQRGCKWTSRLAPARKPGRWYLPADDHNLRLDPDFVEVVRQLNSDYLRVLETLDWEEAKDWEDRVTGGLRVGEVVLVVEIDDEGGAEILHARAFAT